jgi:hypothetical protein
MHSHQPTTIGHDPDDGEPRRRPDLRAVPAARSRRLFRVFGVGTAALVATGGYVHFCLYRHGYSSIPKIGVGFALQVVSSVLVVALLLGPHVVSRVAHVTDRTAGTLTGLAAAGLAAGTLVAFALTRTPGGLFNFQERGLQPSPQALIALLAESGVLVVVGAWLLADQVVQHRLRTAGGSAV